MGKLSNGLAMPNEGVPSFPIASVRPLSPAAQTIAAEKALAALIKNNPFGTELVALEAISSTNKSQVYKVVANGEPIAVLKKAESSDSYFKETLAYEFLGNAILPRLIAAIPSNQILILEYLAKPACLRAADDLKRVIDTIAFAHSLLSITGSEVLQLFDVASLLAPERITPDQSFWRDIFALYRLELGGDYLPICVGDIKTEHIFEKGGRCFLVDLETFTVGGLEPMDLVLFADMIPVHLRNQKIFRWLLEHYRSTRLNIGANSLRTESLLAVTRNIASKYGLAKWIV
jgi:hypothetical protein